jgi:hypothetical protein
MTLTTIDPRPALVVIDLQKGIAGALGDDPVSAAAEQATRLAGEFRRPACPWFW